MKCITGEKHCFGGKMEDEIYTLLQCLYWGIDVDPKQVPKNSGGQCFEVEDYYLHSDRFAAIEVLRPGGNGTD